MLFDFGAYIEDLRTKEEKKEIVEKYEKHFGPISGTIQDQSRYTDYIGGFSTVAYQTPDELKDDFDRKLLMQCVGASFSSECVLEKSEEDTVHELTISVKSGDQAIVKKVSELRSFQVLRLYEIYIEEQMNLTILAHEEEKEREAIMNQREERKRRRELMIDSLDRKELEKEAQVEKEDKLSDLYDQL